MDGDAGRLKTGIVIAFVLPLLPAVWEELPWQPELVEAGCIKCCYSGRFIMMKSETSAHSVVQNGTICAEEKLLLDFSQL